PVPGPGEILVKVAACGICGSDVHGYDGSSGRRIPPIVMGHEAAGRVAKVGPQVTGWAEGDRVTFDSTISCGTCRYCARGEINLCDQRRVLGVSCSDYSCAGAFAEYVIVPQRIVYHLPDSLSFSEAAMLQAVAVAVHAVGLSRISSGNQALVLGAGMIGLLTLQALRAAGCSTLYVADVDASRLKLAKEVGATETLHATGDDLISEVLRLTNNAGVEDRKSTRLNSSHEWISYAVFCLKKKKTKSIRSHVIHISRQQNERKLRSPARGIQRPVTRLNTHVCNTLRERTTHTRMPAHKHLS